MKETGTTHWVSPNTGATNESGFTGLPGGYRYYDGVFSNLGSVGVWWSSSEGNCYITGDLGLYNRCAKQGNGVSVLDFLTPEELAKHKKHLPEFLEARKDPTKWVTLRRGELRIVDRIYPRADTLVTDTSTGETSTDVDMEA